MKKDTAKGDKKEVTLFSLFWAFLKIGLFTIGGGMAMIPLLERTAVVKKKWLTPDEMVDCIALCQSLPGVLAVNMATYVGRRLRGVKGALLATAGVIVPSFVIIILVANVLLFIKDSPYVQGAFTGIKAAMCGLITAVAVRIGMRTLKDIFCWIIAIACFVAVGIFGVNAVIAIACAAALGVAYHMIRNRPKKPGKEENT